MVFSTFKMLYNRYRYIVPDIFITPEGNLVPIQQSLPSPSPWLPLICFLSLQICLFWVSHISKIICPEYVAFCVWLLSFSIMFSSFIHVAECISISLHLGLNNTSLYGFNTVFYPFISCWHLGFFHFLAITNSAALNILVQVFDHMSTCFKFFGELLGHRAILRLSYWGTSKLFQSSCPFYIPTSNAQVFQFLLICTTTSHFPFLNHG